MPTQSKSPVHPDRALSHSSLAQLVEHAAVNRRVVGSNPTGGAKMACRHVYDGKPLFLGFYVGTTFGPLAQLVRATGS